MFNGEFDVPTHRSYGPAAARSLRNGHAFEIPGAGHSESHECTRAMVRDFIADPQRRIDA
jgi:hypothetical protein